MNSTLFTELATENFKLVALEEYTARCLEEWTHYVQFMSSIPDSLDDYNLDDREISTRDLATELLSNAGYNPGAIIAVPEGYVSLRNFVETYLDGLYPFLKYSDPASYDFDRSLDSTIQYAQAVVSAGGVTISPHVTTSVNKINEFLTSEFHALATLRAAVKAQSMKGSKLADKITVFNDFLGSMFDSAFADYSGTSGYFKALISSELSDREFLRYVAKDTGLLDEYEASDSSTFVPNNSVIAKDYSGVSPSIGLAFSTAIKNVGSTIGGIAGFILKACGWLLDNLSPLRKDPVGSLKLAVLSSETIDDIKYPSPLVKLSDGDSSGISELFQIHDKSLSYSPFQYSESLSYGLFVPVLENLESQASVLQMMSILNSKADQWFNVRSIFAEHLFKWTGDWTPVFFDYTNPGSSPVPGCKIAAANVTALSKPRVINKSVYESTISTVCPNGVSTIGDVRTLLRALSAQGDNLYTVPKDVDNDVESSYTAMWGLRMAMRLELYITNLASRSLTYDWDDERTLPEPFPNFSDISPAPIVGGAYAWTPDMADNAAWFKILTGSEDFSSYPWMQYYDDTPSVSLTSQTRGAVSNPIQGWIAGIGVALSRSLYIMGSQPFVPYSQNKVGWSNPDFKVLTDDNIQDRLTAYVSTAINVTVGVAATVAIALVFKKITGRIRADRAKWLALASRRLANGGSLTAVETTKYYRSIRRLVASSSATAGLIGSTGSLLSQVADITGVSADNNSIARIAYLITGK